MANRINVGGYELSFRRWGRGYPVAFVTEEDPGLIAQALDSVVRRAREA